MGEVMDQLQGHQAEARRTQRHQHVGAQAERPVLEFSVDADGGAEEDGQSEAQGRLLDADRVAVAGPLERQQLAQAFHIALLWSPRRARSCPTTRRGPPQYSHVRPTAGQGARKSPARYRTDTPAAAGRFAQGVRNRESLAARSRGAGERLPGFGANPAVALLWGSVTARPDLCVGDRMLSGAAGAIRARPARADRPSPVRRADDGLDRSPLPLLPAPDRATRAALYRDDPDRGDSARPARAAPALRSGGAPACPAARRRRPGPARAVRRGRRRTGLR